MTVLHEHPIKSAQDAVRAAIVQEFRNFGQKKAKVGRPKLPKGEAKGRIVPVRFTADVLKVMEQAARVRIRVFRNGFGARFMPRSANENFKLGHYLSLGLIPRFLHSHP